MSDGFSDGLFRGFIVGAMVGALAVAACGCVPDASAQAFQPLPPGMSYYREMTSDEVDMWRGPRHVTIAPDRVVAYRVGSQWFQAGVEQCIPEGKP